MYTYKAQLVGAANVIEQHLTKTPRYTTIDTTLHMDSCIPQENPDHIIVCLIFSYPPRGIRDHKGNNKIGSH